MPVQTCILFVSFKNLKKVVQENRLSRRYQGKIAVVDINNTNVNYIVLDKDINIIFGRVVKVVNI